MKKMKEIVVISGKGGTGKTTVAASLADLMPDKIVVDADVDAANLYILMKPENIRGTHFKGKSIAQIYTDLCVSCNRCKELCRFHAIEIINSHYKVDHFSCDGCGLCEIACPANAIKMIEQVVGEWFTSQTEFGDFIYARLIPGAENSGNLVTMVKHQAKLTAEEKGIETLLIDGPPGIGCPVISAISGSDLAVILTEPTYSGISDLQRVIELTTHFGLRCGIVINRFDINPENTKDIETFAEGKGVPVIAKIPHSQCIIDEISACRLPSRSCKRFSREVKKIYEYIKTESI
jgi:MinD superfamily P-loop ATPase